MFKACRRALTRVLLAFVGLTLILGQGSAWAHEQRGVAGHNIVVGWDVEPAFTGSANAVGMRVTDSRGGQPVQGLQMKVEVLFGDRSSTRKTAPLDLVPAVDEPGKYSAGIVPSRPGTYTFHITGQLDGEPFDQYFTSGEDTFDPIKDPQEFPVDDPSRGELAERLSRIDARIERSSQNAEDAAGGARRLAMGGIALGIIGLLVALAALSAAREASRRTSAVGPPGPASESTREQ